MGGGDLGVTYFVLFYGQFFFRLVLPIKLFFIRNIIGNSKLIQTVPIAKSGNIGKSITLCACTPLICVSSHPIFTKLTCPAQGYTTWWCVAMLILFFPGFNLLTLPLNLFDVILTYLASFKLSNFDFINNRV